MIRKHESGAPSSTRSRPAAQILAPFLAAVGMTRPTAKVAMVFWLEAAKKEGREVPEPRKIYMLQ